MQKKHSLIEKSSKVVECYSDSFTPFVPDELSSSSVSLSVSVSLVELDELVVVDDSSSFLAQPVNNKAKQRMVINNKWIIFFIRTFVSFFDLRKCLSNWFKVSS